MDWQYAVRRGQRCTVILQVNHTRAFQDRLPATSQASGFMIHRFEEEGLGLLLTNRHSATLGPAAVFASFEKSEVVRCEVIYSDPLHDFALYFFPLAALRVTRIREPLVLNAAGLKVGVDVKIVGNDDEERSQILSGTVAKVNRNPPCLGDYDQDVHTFYALAAANTSSGSSGSPVLNVAGEVIALNTAAANSGAGSYYLPLTRVVEVVDHIKSLYDAETKRLLRSGSANPDARPHLEERQSEGIPQSLVISSADERKDAAETVNHGVAEDEAHDDHATWPFNKRRRLNDKIESQQGPELLLQHAERQNSSGRLGNAVASSSSPLSRHNYCGKSLTHIDVRRTPLKTLLQENPPQRGTLNCIFNWEALEEAAVNSGLDQILDVEYLISGNSCASPSDDVGELVNATMSSKNAAASGGRAAGNVPDVLASGSIARQVTSEVDATAGALIVDEIVPDSVAQSVLQAGDALVRLNGQNMLELGQTAFVKLEQMLDAHVGQSVRLDVCRSGLLLQNLELPVEDLFAICIPLAVLELSFGCFHDVSQAVAIRHHIPRRGVMVAKPGHIFEAFLPAGVVIYEVDGVRCDTLREFEAAMARVRDGDRFLVSFTSLVSGSARVVREAMCGPMTRVWQVPVVWERQGRLGGSDWACRRARLDHIAAGDGGKGGSSSPGVAAIGGLSNKQGASVIGRTAGGKGGRTAVVASRMKNKRGNSRLEAFIEQHGFVSDEEGEDIVLKYCVPLQDGALLPPSSKHSSSRKKDRRHPSGSSEDAESSSDDASSEVSESVSESADDNSDERDGSAGDGTSSWLEDARRNGNETEDETQPPLTAEESHWLELAFKHTLALVDFQMLPEFAIGCTEGSCPHRRGVGVIVPPGNMVLCARTVVPQALATVKLTFTAGRDERNSASGASSGKTGPMKKMASRPQAAPRGGKLARSRICGGRGGGKNKATRKIGKAQQLAPVGAKAKQNFSRAKVGQPRKNSGPTAEKPQPPKFVAVNGCVVFVHPTQNFTLIRFDPLLVGPGHCKPALFQIGEWSETRLVEEVTEYYTTLHQRGIANSIQAALENSMSTQTSQRGAIKSAAGPVVSATPASSETSSKTCSTGKKLGSSKAASFEDYQHVVSRPLERAWDTPDARRILFRDDVVLVGLNDKLQPIVTQSAKFSCEESIAESQYQHPPRWEASNMTAAQLENIDHDILGGVLVSLSQFRQTLRACRTVAMEDRLRAALLVAAQFPAEAKNPFRGGKQRSAAASSFPGGSLMESEVSADRSVLPPPMVCAMLVPVPELDEAKELDAAPPEDGEDAEESEEGSGARSLSKTGFPEAVVCSCLAIPCAQFHNWIMAPTTEEASAADSYNGSYTSSRGSNVQLSVSNRNAASGSNLGKPMLRLAVSSAASPALPIVSSPSLGDDKDRSPSIGSTTAGPSMSGSIVSLLSDTVRSPGESPRGPGLTAQQLHGTGVGSFRFALGTLRNEQAVAACAFGTRFCVPVLDAGLATFDPKALESWPSRLKPPQAFLRKIAGQGVAALKVARAGTVSPACSLPAKKNFGGPTTSQGNSQSDSNFPASLADCNSRRPALTNFGTLAAALDSCSENSRGNSTRDSTADALSPAQRTDILAKLRGRNLRCVTDIERALWTTRRKTLEQKGLAVQIYRRGEPRRACLLPRFRLSDGGHRMVLFHGLLVVDLPAYVPVSGTQQGCLYIVRTRAGSPADCALGKVGDMFLAQVNGVTTRTLDDLRVAASIFASSDTGSPRLQPQNSLLDSRVSQFAQKPEDAPSSSFSLQKRSQQRNFSESFIKPAAEDSQSQPVVRFADDRSNSKSYTLGAREKRSQAVVRLLLRDMDGRQRMAVVRRDPMFWPCLEYSMTDSGCPQIEVWEETC
ncbi:unnamed protein product [Amoebophrya sp. A25]|nr:unnamed protein product [Amoebophrya sp. A25]|eukprot:GSA25T00005704001.1